MVIASTSLAGLGWVATGHVQAAGEVVAPTAWGFATASVSVGATAVWAVWPLLRREQWWLSSIGVAGHHQLWASAMVTACVVAPSVVGMGGAFAMLTVGEAALGVLSVLGTLLWTSGRALALDAHAVARREPKRRRDGRLVLALILPVVAVAGHPTLTLPLGVLGWRFARHWTRRAAEARRRFELGDLEDDHD
jgi:hypothetical protein